MESAIAEYYRGFGTSAWSRFQLEIMCHPPGTCVIHPSRWHKHDVYQGQNRLISPYKVHFFPSSWQSFFGMAIAHSQHTGVATPGLRECERQGKGIQQGNMRERILIADDEESIRFTFSSFLYDAGYRVETASTLSDCLAKMREGLFDLLFLDISFGSENSLDVLQDIKEMHPECSVVMITGSPHSRTITRARQFGALDYMVKPIRQASLLYVARKALAEKNPSRTRNPA